MGKGRPPKVIIEEAPRKFVRTFRYKDGSYSEWHYDLDIYPDGPLEVEIFYPDSYVEDYEKKSKKNKK
jgi:hypothetical protein